MTILVLLNPHNHWKNEMKKIFGCILLCCAINANAQSVIRGEVSAGVYANIKTDSSGNLYTTSTTTVSPATGTVTNRSGTITLGGTAQTAVAINTSRKYLVIQNTSDTDLWFNFTTTATADQPSFKLIPSASFVMESSFISTELISVIGATTGKSFTIKEGQ